MLLHNLLDSLTPFRPARAVFGRQHVISDVSHESAFSPLTLAINWLASGKESNLAFESVTVALSPTDLLSLIAFHLSATDTVNFQIGRRENFTKTAALFPDRSGFNFPHAPEIQTYFFGLCSFSAR